MTPAACVTSSRIWLPTRPHPPVTRAAARSNGLRTLYRSDDLTTLLPLGQLQALGLPGESYKLAFTPGLLTQVFQRPHAGQPAEPLLPDPAAVLGGQDGDRGGYLRSQALKADGRFPAERCRRPLVDPFRPVLLHDRPGR